MGYYLYLMCQLLHFVPTFTVLQVKNKHKHDVFESSGSPAIQMKIEVGVFGGAKTVCEVQLYLDTFLCQKRLSHKAYEIERVDASQYAPLLKPLFPSNCTVDMRDKKAMASKAAEYFLRLGNAYSTALSFPGSRTLNVSSRNDVAIPEEAAESLNLDVSSSTQCSPVDVQ